MADLEDVRRIALLPDISGDDGFAVRNGALPSEDLSVVVHWYWKP
jgi:hypothetical protein